MTDNDVEDQTTNSTHNPLVFAGGVILAILLIIVPIIVFLAALIMG